MNNNKETPEELRERLRQEELKKPFSSIHGSTLSDLVGGMGWRFTGIIILLLIILLVGFLIIYRINKTRISLRLKAYPSFFITYLTHLLFSDRQLVNRSQDGKYVHFLNFQELF